MQVISAQDGMIPFFELTVQLKKKQKQWKQTDKRSIDSKIRGHRQALGDRNWVTKTCTRYLEKTSVASGQSQDIAKAFLEDLDAKRLDARENGKDEDEKGSWVLMSVEKLQLVDTRPSSQAELVLESPVLSNIIIIHTCI